MSASVSSLSGSDLESVSRLFLGDLWKSSTPNEIFRVEGHVSMVCKVALQFDHRMSFTAHARFVCSCLTLIFSLHVSWYSLSGTIGRMFLCFLCFLFSEFGKCRLVSG